MSNHLISIISEDKWNSSILGHPCKANLQNPLCIYDCHNFCFLMIMLNYLPDLERWLPDRSWIIIWGAPWSVVTSNQTSHWLRLLEPPRPTFLRFGNLQDAEASTLQEALGNVWGDEIKSSQFLQRKLDNLQFGRAMILGAINLFQKKLVRLQ